MPSPEELLAKAQALASFAEDRGLHDEHIRPTMGEWKVAARIAAATGMKAREQGLAAVSLGETDLYRGGRERRAAIPGTPDCARSRHLNSDRAWLP